MPTSSLYVKRGERWFLNIPILRIKTTVGLLPPDKPVVCLWVLMPELAIKGVLLLPPTPTPRRPKLVVISLPLYLLGTRIDQMP